MPMGPRLISETMDLCRFKWETDVSTGDQRTRSETQQTGSRASQTVVCGGRRPSGQSSRNVFIGAQRARIAGRTFTLSDALARLKDGDFDALLLGPNLARRNFLSLPSRQSTADMEAWSCRPKPPQEGLPKPRFHRRENRFTPGILSSMSTNIEYGCAGRKLSSRRRSSHRSPTFTRHPRHLLSHETLLEAFWGEPTAPIEPLRQTFRAKVESSVLPRYIVTPHRLGYRFNPSPYQIP